MWCECAAHNPCLGVVVGDADFPNGKYSHRFEGVRTEQQLQEVTHQQRLPRSKQVATSEPRAGHISAANFSSSCSLFLLRAKMTLTLIETLTAFFLVGVWLGVLLSNYKVMLTIFQACSRKQSQDNEAQNNDQESGVLMRDFPAGRQASDEVASSPTEGQPSHDGPGP